MKRAFLFVLLLFAVISIPIDRASTKSETARVYEELIPQKIQAAKFAVSRPVADLGHSVPDAKNKSRRLGKADSDARTVENKEPFRKQIPGAVHGEDAAIAKFGSGSMPTPLQSFDGLSSNDNAAVLGFRVIPPDTIGDIGPNHYVQAVNTLFRVYNKKGAPLTPPLALSSLFEPLGTACAVRNDGDPIVLYDTLSDRWLISQFCKATPPFRQMIAISKTGDPTGEFYIYEFVMPNVKLNDYPKFGFWHDALYMSTDEFFGSDYAGSGAFAFDIKKMIQGDPTASFIYFDLASPTTMRIGGILPVDLDGLRAPPASTPGMFIGYSANEYGDPVDALRLFEFRPDFDNVLNSTFAEAAFSPLGTVEFDPTSPVGRADIKQPEPGEDLDSQSDRLMYRVAYRNFGTSESFVISKTVRITPQDQTYRAGLRVWELNRPIGGVFTFLEQSTLGTDDTSRFMGAASQDHEGNLAFSYNTSNEEKQPSIFYSGRLRNEPLGGLLILAGPLLTTLLQYGKFNAFDVHMAQRSLWAFAVGVPGFMFIKVLASGFYAKQNVKTPVKYAVIAMVTNMLLNLLLVFPLAHAGLALATALSSSLNSALLFWGLRKRGIFIPQPGWLKFAGQLCLANGAMALLLCLTTASLPTWLEWAWYQRASHLAMLVIGSVLVYGLTLQLCGVRIRHFLRNPTEEDTSCN